MSRLAKLWIPLGKKLVLEGVIIGGATIYTELEKTTALGNAWQPTFNSKAFDPIQAQEYFDELGNFGKYRAGTSHHQIICNTSRQLDEGPTLHQGQILCHMLLGKPQATEELHH